MYDGQMMETQEFSRAPGRTVAALIPLTASGRIRPQAAVGSPMAVGGERRFDQRALLRWADDGGRSEEA